MDGSQHIGNTEEDKAGKGGHHGATRAGKSYKGGRDEAGGSKDKVQHGDGVEANIGHLHHSRLNVLGRGLHTPCERVKLYSFTFLVLM